MTSTSIYTDFTPTYLYIKKHSITGKLYFGKTIRNPEKYYGSGTHWGRHIKKHGKCHVDTLWYCLFYDVEECIKFALMFSEQQNIVESTDWLNMRPENGLDGGTIGLTQSEETKQKKSIALIGRKRGPPSKETRLKQKNAIRPPRSQEARGKQSKTLTGRLMPKEIKNKISAAKRGRPNSTEHNTKNSIAHNNIIAAFDTSTLKFVQVPRDIFESSSDRYIGNRSKIIKNYLGKH